MKFEGTLAADVLNLARLLQTLVKAGDTVRIYAYEHEERSEWCKDDEGFTTLLRLSARMLDGTFNRYTAEIIYDRMDEDEHRHWRCFVEAFRPER